MQNVLQESHVNNDAVRGWKVTPEGFLDIEIPLATPGVLVYDQKRGDAFTAKEYRSEAELFNADSMNTLIGKPVTVSRHPRKGVVDAENHRQESAGIVTRAYQQDGWLWVTAQVRDSQAIGLIQRDKSLRGASAGYFVANKVRVNGTAPNGDAYDTDDKGLTYNHVSIVRNPRVKAARFNLDGKPVMELEEALEKIKVLEGEKTQLTSDLSTARGDLLKANNRILNMDSANNEAYERGLKDGEQKVAIIAVAKTLKINIDEIGDDFSLVKKAIIKKANPELNLDGYSDENIDVALTMALMQVGKKFEQAPKTPRQLQHTNTDAEGKPVLSAHQQYEQNTFGKKQGAK